MKTGNMLVQLLLAGLLAGCGMLDTGGELTGDAGNPPVDAPADTGDGTVPDAEGDPTDDPPPDGGDAVTDVDPDLPCVTVGCQVKSPASCCTGLEEVNDCLPGLPCPEGIHWCIRCGDGNCSPRETAFNCPADCPGGCEMGVSMSYGCDPADTYDCKCAEDPCIPYCDMMRGAAWIDPCMDLPIPGTDDPACFPFGEIHCLHGGTPEEGWYDTQWGGEHLVRPGACQPRWDCGTAG